MRQITYLIILSSFYIFPVHGQNLQDKHKRLFEFIKLPPTPGMPLLTNEIEKFKLDLSLEVLHRMNNGTAQDMMCIVDDLVPLKNIRMQHLEIISEMLDRYEYHESGYIPCQATKSTLSTEELSDVEKVLWQDPLLNNESPSGYCRGRAFLTSKKLDSLGFKSKMMTMKGNILATYKIKSGYRNLKYLDHVVNVVEVQDKDKMTEFVLDPMFTDRPIPLKDYLEMTSASIYSPTTYEFKHQSYADKLAPPLRDEACQYNVKLLKDYQSAIEESLKNPESIQGSLKSYNTRDEAKQAQIKDDLEFKP